jgi:hypothetical protein
MGPSPAWSRSPLPSTTNRVCPEDRREEIDQIALPGRPDVDHKRPLRDKCRAVPDDVGSPSRAVPGALGRTHLAGRGREGVRRVVAEEFQISADERVHGAFGGRVQAVVEAEELERVLGERAPAPVGSGGDPGHQ